MKEIQDQLKKSEEMPHTPGNHCPDAVSRWDKDLKLVYANPVFVEKTGMDLSALIGRTLLEMGQPEAIAHAQMNQLKEVFENRAPADHYDSFTRHSTVHFFTRMEPEFAPDGSVESVLVTARDITGVKTAIKDMEENYDFLRKITDFTHEIIYVFDLEQQKIIYANKRLFDVLGEEQASTYKESDVFQKVLHPEDEQRRREYMATLSSLKESESKEIRLRLRTAGGDWHWFCFTDRLFKRNDDGTPGQIIGLVEDITDEMKAKEELNSNLSLLTQTEFIAHIGSWVHDLEKSKPEWSAEVYRIYGYEPYSVEPNMELVRKHVHPEDFSHMMEVTKQAIASKASAAYQCRILANDGPVKQVLVKLGFDAAYPNKLLGIIQDITNESKLRQQLADRQRFIETLVDNSVDRIQAFDKDLTVLVWNKKCEEYYGLSKEQVLGRQLFDFFPKVSGQSGVTNALKSAFEGERTYVPPQQEIYAKAITERHYVPLKDEKGEVYAVIAFLHDVTKSVKASEELKELNRSLEYKNRELEAKNEEISSFAFIASHDLKEPLRKIHTYSSWLHDKEINHLTEKGREYCNRITLAVRRMDMLIEDIMVLTKIHNDHKEAANVDLNAVLNNVTEELRPLITKSKAEINIGSLPAVAGIENQLFYLFKNLIHNSLVFQQKENTPKVNIAAEWVKATDLPQEVADMNRPFLKVSLSDNGIGFDPKYIKKVFQVFQRLHPKHEYQGTGMGLAICKKIMENHGGFITAESEEGRGTVFLCYFPG